MADAATYSLTTTGDILEGFELQDVVTGFASLFEIPPEKAAAYIDQRKLIRKGLSRDETDEYVQQLAKIGLPVEIHTGVISRPRHIARIEAGGLLSDANEASSGIATATDEVPEELLPHEFAVSSRLPIILIGLASVLASAFAIAFIRTGGFG